MDDSDLLAFAPVPVRFRVHGWTPRRQYFFILLLAHGYRPGRAAALLGMSRKSAYELRRKLGGEGFAWAWDAAMARARERRRAAQRPSLAERARHGEWHPRLQGGHLVGWTHKPANARLMGQLKRLDKQIERLPRDTDPANLDRYLASLAAEGDSSGEKSCVRR